jgi:hypothetical protein
MVEKYSPYTKANSTREEFWQETLNMLIELVLKEPENQAHITNQEIVNELAEVQ